MDLQTVVKNFFISLSACHADVVMILKCEKVLQGDLDAHQEAYMRLDSPVTLLSHY
jgi:hypothetical protein